MSYGAAVTADPGLPAMTQALDTQGMTETIVGALGLDTHPGVTLSARVLKHKLAQRCTVEYVLEGFRERVAGPSAVGVIGKLYPTADRALRAHELTRLVRAGTSPTDGHPEVPAPLAFVEDLAMVLYERCGGADLSESLARGEGKRPLTLTAQWLARLHSLPRPPGVETRTHEHALRKVEGWCDTVESSGCLREEERRRLRRAESTLQSLGKAMSSRPSDTLIHRDIYSAHVLWDEPRIWILDFDELSAGDPALDVGHFLAHLESLSLRTTGGSGFFATEARVFLEAYLAEASLEVGPALSFYRASTFLKLAATRVRRRKASWAELARALTHLACREVEAWA